jgi:hypothetical protein
MKAIFYQGATMAKKRYFQSRKDRMDESRGGHARDKFNDEVKHDRDHGYIGERPSSEGYAGMESRRKMEMEDAGMIREDRSAIANLPQNVMIKPYPKTGPYEEEMLDDTIRGIDKQMDYDDSQRQSHFYPKKV